MEQDAPQLPSPGAAKGETGPTPRRRHADFWRACRYLYPHRRIVIISIVCAFVAGLAATSGLGAVLPILRVLINGESVPAWMDRTIVERRLGAGVIEGVAAGGGVDASDPLTLPQPLPEREGGAGAPLQSLELIRIKPDAAAARAGLESGDAIVAADSVAPLSRLAEPELRSANLTTADGRVLSIDLPPVPGYLAALRRAAGVLPAHPVGQIAAVFGLIALLAVFANTIRFFQEYLSDQAAILAIHDIRKHLYDHVLHIPLGFFGLKGTSDVTSRLVQDATTLESGFKAVLGKAVQEPIKAGMFFGLALFLNWKLTLFIIVFAPLMMVLIRKFGKKMRRASRKALQSSASMLGQLEGTLMGIRVVKAANAERFERRRYTGIMDGLVRQNLRMSRVDAMSSPILETLTLLVVGIIVLYAAYLVLVSQALAPETFILVMACLAGIGDSLKKLTKINNAIQKANAAAGRLFETLAVPIERRREVAAAMVAGSDNGSVSNVRSEIAHRGSQTPARPLHRTKLPPIAREIRFERVSFTYPGAAEPAVRDVNLEVPRGQCTAIVGRNGSGKTTLLAMLPRFYDPDEGRVLIDGMDIRDVSLRSLRRQIGVVTQDAVLFPGTIAGNIAYGLPRAAREEIVAAARQAFAHEFIVEKPDGYDTLVGEQGARLSGGQKQRICIARAILHASPILILDEATSQVDAESEHLIQQALDALIQDRTTFVIAHRFSTILRADTIVVMDAGRIVGQGSHDQLLQSCPTYLQLYERQLFSPQPATVA